MIKISKQNNSLIVEGIDNVFYPNNGDNSYPLNSLIVVTDNSEMATFRSVATNDVLFSGLIKDITINGEAVTKDNIIEKFDTVSNSSTGGGTVDAYTKEEADAKFASKDELNNVQTVANDADTKVDALTTRVDGVETAMDGKQDLLVSGTNIKTINNQSILGEGNLEISGDVDLTNYYTKTEADGKFATITRFNEQAADISALQTDMMGKQATLVSGENIKTINSESILGTGDIQINGVSEEQAQEIAKIPTLETELNNKQDTLVSGTNIKTVNSQSILGEGNIEVSGGAKIYKAAEINSDFDGQLFNCIDHLNTGENYSQSISIGDNETIYDNFFNNIKYGDIVLMSRRIILAQYNTYLCEYRGQNGGYYRFVVILNKFDNLSNFTADISIYYDKTNGTITFNTNNGGPAAKKTDIPNTDNFATKNELKAVETEMNNKQDILVSGTNIKTVNSQSILGEGNIEVTIPDATTATSGAMSATDKTKLDSISNEWTGTQAEYDALTTKDNNTLYYVTE